MSHNVIRPNADGIDINYGEMVVGNIRGIPYAVEALDAQKLGLSVVPYQGKEFPQFVNDMYIHPRDDRNTYMVYALEHEDLPALGQAMCEVLNRDVWLNYLARGIMIWVPGQPVKINPIESFYTGLTTEQVGRTVFKE